MPFSVDNLEAVDKKLESMLNKLDYFSKVEMGHVLSQWQTDNIHRHRPFTLRWRGQKRQVVTKFRPHSLYEVKRSLLAERRAKRHGAPPLHTSTRPILREDMWQLLVDQMTRAFHDTIKW
jgi:hypothetical protein